MRQIANGNGQRALATSKINQKSNVNCRANVECQMTLALNIENVEETRNSITIGRSVEGQARPGPFDI